MGAVIMEKKQFLMRLSGLMLVCGMIIAGCENGTTPPATQKTCTVTFDGGEGTGAPPEKQTIEEGKAISLPGKGNLTAPDEKEFSGWKGDGKTLEAGDSYTVTKDVTFIAQWKEKNAAPATNPLKGTWLSRDLNTVLYFDADTMYQLATDWEYSSEECKVNQDTGLAYKIGYYKDGNQFAEYAYAINSAKTELTEQGVKYTRVDAPESPDRKSPIAGFWVTGDDPTEEQYALVISKAMEGDYFTILYGDCEVFACIIEKGQSKIGGGSATAYKYTLTENDSGRGETTLNIRIGDGMKDFVRADTLYPASFF
jgi:hypothetical protein